jgi:ornithine--oxo-acid transaminase
LTQICGNNFMVLKVAPPLVVTEHQLDYFVDSIRDVVEMVHSSGAFWSEAMAIGRRAISL